MQFNSLSRTTNIFKSVWIRWGTGFVYSDGLPMAFTTKTLSLFEGILSGAQIQLFVFSLLIFGAIYGVFLLCFKMTKSNSVSLSAGLFYFLNLYSMSQVWRRS